MSIPKISTKELAKKLGSVKKFPAEKAESVKLPSRKAPKDQQFAYLVVLDFEATCWQSHTRKNRPEIIEFPAVILDTKTGEIVDEFQRYVRPTENPVLSDYCTELTGIKKEQVENCEVLDFALRKFQSWLNSFLEKQGECVMYDHANFKHRTLSTNAIRKNTASLPRLVAMATWSDWDLQTCLHNECARKKIHKPSELNSWIDIRHLYKGFYKRLPNGLRDAVENAGLKFIGREHSGIVDARNTAALAYLMIEDGCAMKITRSIEKSGRRVHLEAPPSSVGAILDRVRTYENGTTSRNRAMKRATDEFQSLPAKRPDIDEEEITSHLI